MNNNFWNNFIYFFFTKIYNSIVYSVARMFSFSIWTVARVIYSLAFTIVCSYISNFISKIEEKIKELESKIQILTQQIDKLKRNLEVAMQNPDELSRNLTSFYLGWRQFLNGSSDFNEVKILCEQTYNNFISNSFTTLNK